VEKTAGDANLAGRAGYRNRRQAIRRCPVTNLTGAVVAPARCKSVSSTSTTVYSTRRYTPSANTPAFSGNQDWKRRVGKIPDTELSPDVVAPASNGLDSLDVAAVMIAAANPDCVDESGNGRWNGPVRSAAVAQFTVAVFTPAHNRCIDAQRACVIAASGDRDRVCKPDDTRRTGPKSPSAIADLSGTISSPTIDQAIVAKGARMVRSRRNIDVAGQRCPR
jgi:hypothetical protein